MNHFNMWRETRAWLIFKINYSNATCWRKPYCTVFAPTCGRRSPVSISLVHQAIEDDGRGRGDASKLCANIMVASDSGDDLIGLAEGYRVGFSLFRQHFRACALPEGDQEKQCGS